MANQSARTIWIILLNMLGSLMWHLTSVHCWKAVCPSSIIPPSKDCWKGVPWIGWIITNQDMLATGLPTDNWELHAADRSDWRSVCSLALQAGEERLKAEAVDRRAKRRAAMNKATCVPVACVFVCSGCGRVCRSRIGLFSHERKCLSQLR